MRSTGGGNGKPFQYSCWETHEEYEKAKIYDTARCSCQARRCPICYREKWRAITNSSRKNDAAGPKQRRCWAVDVSGGEGEVQCWKEQYCLGTCGIGEDSWQSLGARWNQSILKEINPEYSLEDPMLSSLAGRFFSSVLLCHHCPALEERRAENSHHSHEECPSRGGCPDGGKDLRSRNDPWDDLEEREPEGSVPPSLPPSPLFLRGSLGELNWWVRDRI